jgi:hypothetical protein
MSNAEMVPEAKEHYAYVTRSLIRLFNSGMLPNVANIDVEPEYGYTSRITYDDGSHRVTYGNDLGLNTGAAEDLAKDKGHTKFLLRTIGVDCPKGSEFLLPWWADAIRESQSRRGNDELRTTDQAFGYVLKHLGYPVYVKPVAGSKGLGVRRVDSEPELQEAFDELEESRSRVAIVEESIAKPDYRIVVLDGELISAYERVPLAVLGDGTHTIADLVDRLQQMFRVQGRDTTLSMSDPRILKTLNKLGLDAASVVPKGKKLTLVDVSNLSAGGTSLDFTKTISERWVNLARYVAHNFNLRLCGVDLACDDIELPAGDYSVLEVNSTPGLDHYASSGEDQLRIVDELYAKVLNAYPS